MTSGCSTASQCLATCPLDLGNSSGFSSSVATVCPFAFLDRKQSQACFAASCSLLCRPQRCCFSPSPGRPELVMEASQGPLRSLLGHPLNCPCGPGVLGGFLKIAKEVLSALLAMDQYLSWRVSGIWGGLTLKDNVWK